MENLNFNLFDKVLLSKISHACKWSVDIDPIH